MRKNRKTGVYAIECVKSVYVGASVDITNRWAQHRNVLRRGLSEIDGLQKAWNDNSNGFEFKVLEQCDSVSLRDRETFWIKEYISRGWNVWNRVYRTEVTILNIPKEYIPTFKKLVKALDLGSITLAQLEQATEQ
jgi:hypothetical protein